VLSELRDAEARRQASSPRWLSLREDREVGPELGEEVKRVGGIQIRRVCISLRELHGSIWWVAKLSPFWPTYSLIGVSCSSGSSLLPTTVYDI
jgi:hypothetical protein